MEADGGRAPWRSHTGEWSVLLAALPAVGHLVYLGRIFAARLTYPADLEWMEGGQLYHAHRLLHGDPVYGGPDQGFVPFGYGPVHAGALAAVGRVTGLDYWSGRLLSVVAIVVVAVVLYRQVVRHTGSGPLGITLGLLATGTIAAGFPVTGGWFDLVRADSLAIAVPVGAAALAAEPERLGERRRWVTLALLLAASVLTKQSNLFLVAWIGLFVLVVDRRAARRIGLLAVGATVAALVGLQVASGGWFLTWFGLMAHHGLQPGRLPWALEDLGGFAPYLALVPMLVVVGFRRGWLTHRTVLWAGMLAAAAPTALVPFLKIGGHPNNLLPIVALAGPATVLLVVDVGRGMAGAGGSTARAVPMVKGLGLVGGAALLLGLWYPASSYVPSAARRDAADRLNALMADLDGGVLVPGSPFLPVRNGRPGGDQVHSMAHFDAWLAGVDDVELERYIAASEAEWVLIDPYDWAVVWRAGGYERVDRSVPEVTTMTGAVVTPSALYHRVGRPGPPDHLGRVTDDAGSAADVRDVPSPP